MSAPPLGKYLASTDKKTRDKAIESLAAFLSDGNHAALPRSEMAKLWKGIFYCYWMSDKPLVQQALSTELADLVLTISSSETALAFLRGFWESVIREWNNIDYLRLDKYLMLVRKYVGAAFRLLSRVDWDPSACEAYNSILMDQAGPLSPDIKTPTSLSYHMADVWLEELEKVLNESTSTARVPLATLLTPFLILTSLTSTNTTITRIQTSLLEPLFSALDIISSLGQDEGDEPRGKGARLISSFPCIIEASCRGSEPISPMELRRSLLKTIFGIASREETREASRRKMYAFWKEIVEADGAPEDE